MSSNQSKLTSPNSTSVDNQLDNKPSQTQTVNSVGVMPAKAPDIVSTRFFTLLALIVVLFLFLAVFVWGSFAPLSSAAVAQGSVKVEGNIKQVQHLEGGIVADILVANGDRVQANQILVRLDPTQPQTELDTLEAQRAGLLAKQARLMAERDQAAGIEWSPCLVKMAANVRTQKLIEAQQLLFAERRDRLQKEQAILQAKIGRIKEQISGLGKLIANKKAYLATYQDEEADLANLYQRDLVSRQQVRETQRTKLVIEGEVAELENSVASAKVEIVEVEEQMLLSERHFGEEVLAQLDEVTNKLHDLTLRKVALEDRLARMQIRAPVDGVVEDLAVFAQRAVIAPGQSLMTIVPQAVQQLIEVQIEPTDIDKVVPKLFADVRFSAYNSQDVFLMEAKVNYVSADKQTNPNTGQNFYIAKLALTEKGQNQVQANGFEIKTGMPVEVMIKTGERTFWSYLTKPFSTMIARAFNED